MVVAYAHGRFLESWTQCMYSGQWVPSTCDHAFLYLVSHPVRSPSSGESLSFFHDHKVWLTLSALSLDLLSPALTVRPSKTVSGCTLHTFSCFCLSFLAPVLFHLPPLIFHISNFSSIFKIWFECHLCFLNAPCPSISDPSSVFLQPHPLCYTPFNLYAYVSAGRWYNRGKSTGALHSGLGLKPGSASY